MIGTIWIVEHCVALCRCKSDLFFADEIDEIAEVASISTLVFGMALGFTSPAIDVMQDTLKVNGKAASVPSDLVTLQSTNLRDVMEIRCDKF
jgi:hypothetical protein